MSNRLGGKQGTAYVGTNAIQPPDYTFSDRSPTQYDINNVSVGDFWLNQTDESLWVLVSLAGNSQSAGSLATWSKLEAGGISALNQLTGNTGGHITPDGSANINVVGDGVGVTVTGNPGTSTLTISLVGGGEAAESFPTDVGTATPVNGVLNIKAGTAGVNDGSTIFFSGSGNNVTLNVTDTSNNTIIGKASGSAFITGGDNTILGEGSGFALTSGSDNTMIGAGTGASITVGANNILLGSGTGQNLTVGDDSNTLIGASGFAGAADFIAIASGAGGTTFLHNYPGVNASTSNGGNTFIGNNAGNFTLAGAPGNASNDGFGDGALGSLTTGAMNNAMGAFALAKLTTGSNNIAVGHNAGFNSGGNTGITTGQFNVLVGYTAGDSYTGAESSNIIIGGATGTVGQSNMLIIGDGTGSGPEQLNKSFIHGIRGITPTVNDGIPVFINSLGQLGTVGSGGATVIETVTGNSGGAVDPSAGNINIIGDGTSISITGNPGTNTLTVAAIGGPGGLSTLTGDTGGAISPLAGNINILAGVSTLNCGSSVEFVGSAHTITLDVTDLNNNTIIGANGGNATLTGANNTGFGFETLAGLTSGTFNTVLGVNAGDSLTTGSFNILIGSDVGSNYTSLESNNILIGSPGVATETHALRIASGTGTGLGQVNQSFIGGIRGITPTVNDGIPVFINSLGQLGTVGSGGTSFVSTVTGNAGGAVSPAAGGNLNIVGDGTTIVISGNPGTNTLTVVGLGGGGGTLSQLSGDLGSALPTAGIINVITNNAAQDAGSSVLFSGTGDTLSLFVTDANDNTLIGFETGIAGISGINNTALGSGCARALTTGTSNIFIGIEAGNLVTTGSDNFLCGDATTAAILKGTTTSTGLYGFGIGSSLFLHNWGGTASANTFVGADSGSSFNAGQQAANKRNTACGAVTLSALTTGTGNSTLGYASGVSISSGSNNTLIGLNAGSNYSSSESSNICIGSGVSGTAAENNALRIGAATGTGTGQLNKAFIAGIRGITPATVDGIPVFIGSAGQLGTIGNGGSSLVSTLTGNTGGVVGPAVGNINVIGDGTSITVVGNPGTNTLTISAVGGGGGLTTLKGDDGVPVTEVAGVINVVAQNSTQQAGSTVGFSGSGNTLVLNVTDTNENTMFGFQAGNAGITGTNNTAVGELCGRALTSGSSNIFLGIQAGSLVQSGSGNFLAGDATLAPILKGTANSTGFYAFGIGANLFLHNWGGQLSGNTFIGSSSGVSFNSGQQVANKQNTACGAGSLASITTAAANVALGFAAGNSFTTGQNNTLIGIGAGSDYETSESSNICIGGGVVGTVGTSNTLTIGVATGSGLGQLNTTRIHGIRGITTGINNAIPVVIDSSGQLGTAGGSSVVTTLTGNTGGAVSSSGGNINVRGDGVSVNVSGNAGTSTLTISAIGGSAGPSFSVYLATPIPNAITLGSLYTVTYDTILNNTGSAFNLGTSRFTAPVTGLYNFSAGIYCTRNPVVSTLPVLQLTTTRNLFSVFPFFTTAGSTSSGQWILQGNWYCNMTAGDTAFMTIIFSGSAVTPTINVSGIASPFLPLVSPASPGIVTYFAGELV
jgi:hypothetical protein